MEYDNDKVDEMVLALLYLTMFSNKGESRAWKGHDWDAMDRLHQKGYISEGGSVACTVVVNSKAQGPSDLPALTRGQTLGPRQAGIFEMTTGFIRRFLK